MKAILCLKPGPSETLKLSDMPDPKPGKGEVVVDVAFTPTPDGEFVVVTLLGVTVPLGDVVPIAVWDVVVLVGPLVVPVRAPLVVPAPVPEVVCANEAVAPSASATARIRGLDLMRASCEMPEGRLPQDACPAMTLDIRGERARGGNYFRFAGFTPARLGMRSPFCESATSCAKRRSRVSSRLALITQNAAMRR